MTAEELRTGQREAHAVTRTAYVNREVRFKGLDKPVTVTPSGDAYMRDDVGTLRLFGRVTRVGDEFHLFPTRQVKGKAARRQQKRRRQLQRVRFTPSAVTT